MKCAVCGKEFTSTRITQRYCSYTCRRYANHHGINDNRVEGPLYAPTIREFTCLQCGKRVRVTETRDCRTKFCSQHCEKLYWKHPEKKREKGIRQFQCHACGKNVIVTDPLDRRRFYCSETCREAQHRAKQKVIRAEKDQGVSN